ncbi:MAG: radical SAM protein [Bryobacterales bacterium]|nr:radical SAM protein [Bryobacterales bacterium]
MSTYDLGHQPFGVASPAAWLAARGHQVSTIDLAVTELPTEPIAAADAIAFHLPMHTAARLAAPVAHQVKQLNPQARLVAYGLYAPLNADFLRQLGIPTTIGGEFEEALAAAIEGRPASGVFLPRLPLLPPDRSTLPNLGQYPHFRIGDRALRTGYTEASRGCKHLCRHCPVVPVYDGVFRIVPRETVLADIRNLVAAGAEHITFGDPDFFNGPTHAVRLVEMLHAEFPAISYDVTIKVEHLLRHRDLLPFLQSTGCVLITTAVESLDDRVLDILAKGHIRADVFEALRLCREAGIPVSPTFVPFNPWTTRDAYIDLLRTIATSGLIEAVAPVQLALRLLLPPGSKLLDTQEIRPHLSGFDPSALLHRWSHPDPSMDDLARAVLRLVWTEQRRKADRRTIFSKIWALATTEPLPEDADRLPRTVVPYLEEPWYC